MPDFKPGDAVWVLFNNEWVESKIKNRFVDYHISDPEDGRRNSTLYWWQVAKALRPRDPAMNGKDKPE